MATVRWRPQHNAITNPQSYKPRLLPRDVMGYTELAKEVARKNPFWSAETIESVMRAVNKEIKTQLIQGNQVTLENAFTCHLTLAARLDTPDAPLPSDDSMLKVRFYPARSFVKDVQRAAQLERLPLRQKLPMIMNAEDTVLELKHVLNPAGALRLTGTDLFFDKASNGAECVIEGTRSGRVVQRRFAMIANTVVLLLPDILTQDEPWNNEYRVSLSTRYTEHGTLRTGTYLHPLRTPLTVVLGHGDGILSGNESAPLVTISNGTMAEASATVRIQVMLDAKKGDLCCNVIDMSENGSVGEVVHVSGEGTYTLSGYAGSAVTQLEITVHDYAALARMVKTDYVGRLVDVLHVSAGT